MIEIPNITDQELEASTFAEILQLYKDVGQLTRKIGAELCKKAVNPTFFETFNASITDADRKRWITGVVS